MRSVPLAIPLVWSTPNGFRLQPSKSGAQIGSDSRRHRELFR